MADRPLNTLLSCQVPVASAPSVTLKYSYPATEVSVTEVSVLFESTGVVPIVVSQSNRCTAAV